VQADPEASIRIRIRTASFFTLMTADDFDLCAVDRDAAVRLLMCVCACVGDV
jgi:hypothetical protein